MSSLEFGLKIDETRKKKIINQEKNHNDLKMIIISEKYKKTCKYLNCVGHLLILASTVILVSISAFASLVCVLVGITSFPVGIKFCAITAGI